MRDLRLTAYADPALHAATVDIIRRRSTNQADLHEFALQGIDLSAVHDVLDLGCGFGSMSGVVASRCASDARVIGVDACTDNGRPFLDNIRRTGRRGEFLSLVLDRTLPWDDGSFDLVLATFSLYFFVGVLPEISRVLRPGGQFLTVTHFCNNLASLLEVADLPWEDTPQAAMIQDFSADNGTSLLDEHFARVERLDYHNSLRFAPEHADDLIGYTRFKMPLLIHGAVADGTVPDDLRSALLSALERGGALEVEKDDAVFRCRDPLR